MTCVSGKSDDPYCKAETLSNSPHVLHFYHFSCIMETWSDLHWIQATSNLINRHPKTVSLTRFYSQSCVDGAWINIKFQLQWLSYNDLLNTIVWDYQGGYRDCTCKLSSKYIERIFLQSFSLLYFTHCFDQNCLSW